MHTGLARQDDMIAKPGATGNSCLRDHNAISPDYA